MWLHKALIALVLPGLSKGNKDRHGPERRKLWFTKNLVFLLARCLLIVWVQGILVRFECNRLSIFQKKMLKLVVWDTSTNPVGGRTIPPPSHQNVSVFLSHRQVPLRVQVERLSFQPAGDISCGLWCMFTALNVSDGLSHHTPFSIWQWPCQITLYPFSHLISSGTKDRVMFALTDDS